MTFTHSYGMQCYGATVTALGFSPQPMRRPQDGMWRWCGIAVLDMIR